MKDLEVLFGEDGNSFKNSLYTLWLTYTTKAIYQADEKICYHKKKEFCMSNFLFLGNREREGSLRRTLIKTQNSKKDKDLFEANNNKSKENLDYDGDDDQKHLLEKY